MKKSFLMFLIVLGFCSCAKDEAVTTGSIYGVVTVKETAEPMRATGVELYTYGGVLSEDGSYYYDDQGSLLLKTVTYDDGHYEFENLKAGEYELRVVASGYADASYSVTVESGRTARADMQLERLNTYMTVTTLTATEITGDKATLNGSYSYYAGYSPKDIGFVYSTSPTPSNGGTTITSSTGNKFSSVVNNLKRGKYYFQAYAKNQIGTEYGEVLSFEISGQPSVTTLEATNVTGGTATLNGRIDYEGDPPYTERGFVYSSSFPNPTIDDPASATSKVVVSGTSHEFSANIAGLTPTLTYYVRAYATNSTHTVYGNAVEFSNMGYVILYADGIMVQRYDISAGATWNDAGALCEASRMGGYIDWRLPTCGECDAIYRNKERLNIFDAKYWTSEYDEVYSYWSYDFSYGKSYSSHKSNTLRVRCVRTL